MKNLLLTLGHNSSAILIEDNKLVWGFETERVTEVKSDSRFPAAVLDHMPKFKPDMVYVSHWAPDGQLASMSKKHWIDVANSDFLDGVPIVSLTADRTHHDAHMAAAMCYAGREFQTTERSFGIVIDGFGNFGEHISIYRISALAPPRLIKRYRGYDTSLGLWYQYATAFMGMKMHEDEYKLLGYEVHVNPIDTLQLDADATAYSMELLDRMTKTIYGSKFDPVFNLEALAAVKESIFRHLQSVCAKYGITDSTTFEARSLLAYYVQAVLEATVMALIAPLNPDRLILSGGVFYNVKLNKRIIDYVDGLTCVYPLAGDQGCAIGLYAAANPEFVFPHNLNWGVRTLTSKGHVPNLHTVNATEAMDLITHYLGKIGYVNLVRDNMEFGPRAMCNTSTLAIPLKKNVDHINEANNRNTVMPMAPVMTQAMYRNLFEKTERVWKSQRHMVVAMEYKEYPEHHLLGVAHEYQRPHHHHTGRPQVVDGDDIFMNKLLNTVGHPLINTSFNFHGMPIALGMDSIIKNHMMQYQRDNSFHTVVIRNE